MYRLTTPPIIIVGCHRSGTSFLADKMKQLGVFMGKDLNDHCESHFFLSCNDRMLKSVASDWSAPSSFLSYLEAEPNAHIMMKTIIQERTKGGFVLHYMGIRMWIESLLCHSFSSSTKWGWKDPRNSITLAVWLDIFPEAKVIHVYRNGNDVAKSLQTREIQRTKRSNYKAEKCKDISYCYQLWMEYENAITATLNRMDAARVMHISFDRLIGDSSIEEDIKRFIV